MKMGFFLNEPERSRKRRYSIAQVTSTPAISGAKGSKNWTESWEKRWCLKNKECLVCSEWKKWSMWELYIDVWEPRSNKKEWERECEHLKKNLFAISNLQFDTSCHWHKIKRTLACLVVNVFWFFVFVKKWVI